MRVLFYVQHLLGIGHLVRARRIAEALGEAGAEVSLVCGGVPVPGFDGGAVQVFQLPPVRAGDEGFSGLVHADGRAFTQADEVARRDLLLSHFETFRPDAVLTEAFPFGRRQMRFELLPLLERARAAAWRPLIAASVRDILQENRKPGRDEETAELVARFYDLVLVHGDPQLATLDETFPLAARFDDKIAYTGIVTPQVSQPLPDKPTHDVIVSAGGGAVGAALLAAALASRPLSSLHAARWLVVSGPNLAERDFARLAVLAGPGVDLVRFVPDLTARMAGARVSISQAGYNTMADVLVAGCRAVLVPFASAGETEQTRRALQMQARGRAQVVTEDELDAARLAAALDAVCARPLPPTNLMLDGAPATARLVLARAARAAT